MDYDLELCYIATIRDDIPALREPEQIRALCVDGDCEDENAITSLTFAQRINDRLRVRWLEGEKGDELYEARLEPHNRHDESDVDYWFWVGEVSAKYDSYGAGFLGDSVIPTTETGKIQGWMFENTDGSTFVGDLVWDTARERIVIVLQASESREADASLIRQNNQITGNVGIYYVCYQLSKLGLNVLPTSRNAKGADIIAYSNDHSTFYTIQVKAMTKLANIATGKSLDNVACDWWIVVTDVYQDPKAFVLTYEEIKASVKLYGGTYWAQKKEFAKREAIGAWDRLVRD